MPTMKIMRRGGDGDTGPSPSKPTSEAGSDGKDKALSAKEKSVPKYAHGIVHSLNSLDYLEKKERQLT